jgi:hypothetical protein
MKIRNRTEQHDWLFRLCWSLAAVFCSAPALSEPRIAGLYVLQTANGKGLPAAVAENKPTGYQLEVTGGSVGAGRRPDLYLAHSLSKQHSRAT